MWDVTPWSALLGVVEPAIDEKRAPSPMGHLPYNPATSFWGPEKGKGGGCHKREITSRGWCWVQQGSNPCEPGTQQFTLQRLLDQNHAGMQE